MRRLSAIEKTGAALGVLCVVIGGAAAVFPKAGVIAHPSVYSKQPWVARSPSHEYISEDQARVYGIPGVALGAGILWFSVYRSDKSS